MALAGNPQSVPTLALALAALYMAFAAQLQVIAQPVLAANSNTEPVWLTLHLEVFQAR